jgi:uncharacterized protein YhaN
MATANGRSGFVKDSIEQAQARLEAFEKEASKVLDELRARSKSSRKELAGLLEKFQAGELFENARTTEKKVEKQLRARANRLSGELADRLAGVQDAVLRFVGVASRDQVEELVSDLERISKRLEKLIKVKPAAKKKAGKGQGLQA